jgi:hypothetical protein
MRINTLWGIEERAELLEFNPLHRRMSRGA